MLRERLVRRGVAVSGGVLFGLISAQVRAAVSADFALSTVKAVAGGAGLSACVETLTRGGLKAMAMAKIKVAAVAAATVTLAASGGGVLAYRALQEPVRPAVEERIAGMERPGPQNFERLQALIRPTDEEWAFMRITWFERLWEARTRAANEGKMVLIADEAVGGPT